MEWNPKMVQIKNYHLNLIWIKPPIDPEHKWDSYVSVF